MFKDLGLCDEILDHLENKRFVQPTEVQKYCIPKILDGQEVISCAETGSGKTAAFLLPIFQEVFINNYSNFAVILAPTRELARQIGEQAKELKEIMCNFKVLIITGGKDYVKLSHKIKVDYNILICTPGRLADMVRNNKTREEFCLSHVKYLVIDEADRMLEEGFGEDLKDIFSQMSKKKKTLLFTATLTGPINNVIQTIIESAKKRGTKPPEVWRASNMTDIERATTVDTLQEYYILLETKNTEPFLFYLVTKELERENDSLIIIFTNKCKWCQILFMLFKKFEFSVAMLHSGMQEKDRETHLQYFKSRKRRILITTNLGSRGLDIPNVYMVINHQVPVDPKCYLHRVGRTARAGRKGEAVTLASLFEKDRLLNIQEYTGKKMTKYPLETDDLKKIAANQTDITITKRNCVMKMENLRFIKQNKKNIKRYAEEEDEPEVESKKFKNDTDEES